MKINSIKKAEEILQEYIPNVSKFSGDNLSLDRMYPLLEAIGNPHKKLKIIHIAGTSGKTSTSYYISSILTHSGLKVGLTVSPHVDSITERIQINCLPLSENAFCSYLTEFLDTIKSLELSPSYFELLIAFVYWVFDKEEVDYAVIETGMGGLLDSTNVAVRPDKVCVITDIGFDHMHILGSTISEIAYQKAGIIHDNNWVFMYKQSADVMEQVEKVVEKKEAVLNIVPNLDTHQPEIEYSEAPLFQKRNWNLAHEVCRAIANRDGIVIDDKSSSLNITVPGRMDVTNLNNGSLLIMDGAHNGQKIETFVESFKEKFHDEKTVILLALKTGKEYSDVIDSLLDISSNFILTTFSTSQDLPAVSEDPKILRQYCDQKGIKSEIIENHKLAFEALLKSNSQIKLVIGSFYLLGQVRKLN